VLTCRAGTLVLILLVAAVFSFVARTLQLERRSLHARLLAPVLAVLGLLVSGKREQELEQAERLPRQHPAAAAARGWPSWSSCLARVSIRMRR
jgi:uncharacterized SAM-binding protein YcdF (DUF218 family)